MSAPLEGWLFRTASDREPVRVEPVGGALKLYGTDLATELDLNVFYSKVQRAFSLQDFAGTVNNAEVAQVQMGLDPRTLLLRWR